MDPRPARVVVCIQEVPYGPPKPRLEDDGRQGQAGQLGGIPRGEPPYIDVGVGAVVSKVGVPSSSPTMMKKKCGNSIEENLHHVEQQENLSKFMTSVSS